jgi:hypothetical protein
VRCASGGFTTNPHLRFAFATTDPVIRGNVESSVAEGEALHPIKVFDQLDDALHWGPGRHLISGNRRSPPGLRPG